MSGTVRPNTTLVEQKSKNDYIGPYENWIFGNGKRYAFPDIRDDNLDYLSAVAELRTLTGISTNSLDPDDKEVSLMFPPLWNVFEQAFVPFFFANDKLGVSEFKSDTLNGLLARLTTAESLKRNNFPINKSTPTEFYYRVNLPIHPRSLHPGHSDAKFNWQSEQLDTNCHRWTRLAKHEKKRLVILAVIEDTIPFAHNTLMRRDENDEPEPMIEYCWVQSAHAMNDTCPMQVPFGQAFTRNRIKHLKKTYASEDELYRKAGVNDHTLPEISNVIDRHATHGSLVLDLLSRGGSKAGDIDPLHDDIRIIAVQLPNTVAWDTSGFGKDMFMLSAVHYIFERAKRIHTAYHSSGDNKDEYPLVLNFSYGFSGGPHDGKSTLEQAIGAMVNQRRKFAPTALVMPSGNTFSDKMHGSILPANFKDENYSFYWRVQPNDRTPSYLEIWFPDRTTANDFDFELKSPISNNIGRTKVRATIDGQFGDPRSFYSLHNDHNEIIGQVTVDKFRGGKWRVLVTLAPTEVPKTDINHSAAPAGPWKLTIVKTKPDQDIDDPIEVYIQRDSDPLELKSGGRQSYLEDLDPVTNNPMRNKKIGKWNEYDKPSRFERRFGSLNGTGTHESTTLVGGYDVSADKAVQYSSSGLMKNFAFPGDPADWRPNEPKVDCSSLSEYGQFTSGITAAGTRSGSFSTLTGTSAAAPLIARKLAMIFNSKTDEELQTNVHQTSNYTTLLSGFKPDTWEDQTRLGRVVDLPKGFQRRSPK